MAASVRARVQNGCLTFGSVGAVIAGVAAIDGTARRYIFDALDGQLPPVLSDLPFQHLAREMTDFIPMGSPAMLAMGAAALILFVLMLRT